jgi:hypothetical protein
VLSELDEPSARIHLLLSSLHDPREGVNGISDAAEHAVRNVSNGNAQRVEPWRRRRVEVVIACLVLAVLVVGLVAVLTRQQDDESQIRALVRDFAIAVAADPFAAAKMLCASEREAFEEQIDPELVLPESPPKPRVSVSGVHVEGLVASATVQPPSGPPSRMYFLKEKKGWTVCAPAGDRADGGP